MEKFLVMGFSNYLSSDEVSQNNNEQLKVNYELNRAQLHQVSRVDLKA